MKSIFSTYINLLQEEIFVAFNLSRVDPSLEPDDIIYRQQKLSSSKNHIHLIYVHYVMNQTMNVHRGQLRHSGPQQICVLGKSCKLSLPIT